MYSSTRVVQLDAISESPGSSTGCSCPSQVFSLIFHFPDISVLNFDFLVGDDL